MSLIEPRTLKGFRDYLPEAQIPREWLIETAKRVYRSYGFLPIDTPALEYEEILTGKGGEESDKQMYRFEDHGGRKVALRFDLTVPLARFVAQHSNALGMPFKRYHIASVWRGENTQRGRYREFMQCDFDTIGTESIAADIETVLVVHDLMKAIGVEHFMVRINNRKVLNGILDMHGVRNHSVPILRALDKIEKIGPDRVIAEIVAATGMDGAAALQLVTKSGGFGLMGMQVLPGHAWSEDAVLRALDIIESETRTSETAQQGIADLRAVFLGLRTVGVFPAHATLDLNIARGLDYYTGTIIETSLGELPGIGSVCSGGRYNDLANLYTKERLPGIGASLGLDRLLAALEELKKLPTSRATAPIFVPWFDEARFHDYLAFTALLRKSGLGVELYPEPKKLKAQLQYADRRGFTYAIVIGSDEWVSGSCQVKNLKTGESAVVSRLDETNDALNPDLLARLRA
ncbi:MAG: histidine--tRNA ligase [Planctomycetota bacterium]|nr:histidine--tRNA ligase [Planctomycetota bacterium]